MPCCLTSELRPSVLGNKHYIPGLVDQLTHTIGRPTMTFKDTVAIKEHMRSRMALLRLEHALQISC